MKRTTVLMTAVAVLVTAIGTAAAQDPGAGRPDARRQMIREARELERRVVEMLHRLEAHLGADGFAVPGPHRGFLGVKLAEGDAGPCIEAVVPESPAAVAGLAAGDVVKAVNGKPVTTPVELISAISAAGPGTKVEVTVLRDGQETVHSIVLAVRPAMEEEEAGEAGDEDDDEEEGMESSALPWAPPPGVAPGFLGVQPVASGVLIGAVIPGSPAEKAGVKVGDLVVAVNGTAVDDVREFIAFLSSRGEGASIELIVIREGKPVTISATLAARPAMEAEEEEGEEGEEELPPPAAFLGVRIAESDDGPRIALVAPGSPAAQAGLAVDDVVKALNGDPVAKPEELIMALRGMAPGAKIRLTVLREGAEQTIEATLAPRPAEEAGEEEGEGGK